MLLLHTKHINYQKKEKKHQLLMAYQEMKDSFMDGVQFGELSQQINN